MDRHQSVRPSQGSEAVSLSGGCMPESQHTGGFKACGSHSGLRPVELCRTDVGTRVVLRCMAVTVTLTTTVTATEVSGPWAQEMLSPWDGHTHTVLTRMTLCH